jgi:hypothetical protein
VQNLRLRRDAGALLLGAIFLAVGCYYVLRNTLGFTLPEIEGDSLWPLAVVALGLSVLYRAWTGRGDSSTER